MFRCICCSMGVIGQFDRELIPLGKGHEPVKKLGAMAVILGLVIQSEQLCLPPLQKTVAHPSDQGCRHADLATALPE
jgi:hypothetical protein